MTGAEKLRRSLGCALAHLDNAVTNKARDEFSPEASAAIDTARVTVEHALRLAHMQTDA
jgi:hypothetical protein